MVKIVKQNEKFYVQESDGTLLEITEKGKFFEKKTGKTWYKLPTNSMNNKLIDENNLVDGYELKYKTPKDYTNTNNLNKKHFTEYLTPEELSEYNRLVELGCQRKKEAETKKPLTEAEKLQLQIKKLEEKIAKMKEHANSISEEDEALEALENMQVDAE